MYVVVKVGDHKVNIHVDAKIMNIYYDARDWDVKKC